MQEIHKCQQPRPLQQIITSMKMIFLQSKARQPPVADGYYLAFCLCNHFIYS